MQIEITKKRAIIIGIVFALIISVVLSSFYVYSIVTVSSNHQIVTPKSTPTLLLTSNVTNPFVGDTILLTAKFNSSIANLPVTFFNNGSVIGGGSFTTDNTGMATLTVNIGTSNIDNITASCTIPNVQSNAILITPQQGIVTLFVDNSTPYVGDTITITAQLQTKTANVPVTFFLNGLVAGTNPIYTDNNGTATITFQVNNNIVEDWTTTAQLP